MPTLALKPRGDVKEKFKTGVSVAPQKGLMSSKNVLNSLQNRSLPLIAIVLQQ